MKEFGKHIPALKKAAACIVPLLLFFCVSGVCFAPQFEGKVLPQHDIEQYEGMAQDIRQHRALTGEDPQWTGSMFGGMPAYLISVEYPSLLVRNSVGRAVEIVSTPTGFIFFAMTAMWLAMILFGLSPWVASVPALAYGLSTYFFLIIGAGHVTKMWAIVYAPLMTAGIFCTLRGSMWRGAVLTALFASLEIGANHPQVTYYFLLAMAAFWINELIFAIREKRIPDFAKRTAVLIAAGVVAVGSNFAPLWYTSQHTPDTIRGGSELAEAADGKRGLDLEYATAWSYGIAESWNMLIPDFAGGYSGTSFPTDGVVGDTLAQYGYRQVAKQLPAYWGGQPYTAGPTYLGAVAIFFAVLGLILARPRDRWWIAAVMAVMLLLSWGRNFMPLTEFCFKWLPMYDKFRTVSMTLLVLEWTVPLLTGIALWRMWNTPKEERRTLLKPVAWAAGITAGACLLMAVAGRYMFDFGQSASEELMLQVFGNAGVASDLAAAMVVDRAAMMEADAWRSFLFIVLTAGVAALYALRKAGPTVLTAVAAVMITVDLVGVDLRFQPYEAFVSAGKARSGLTAADAEILADKDLGYRVYNLSVNPFNDATTSKHHRSVGGYHGAKLARYQDIIDRFLQSGRENEKVLDMLNTRYVIERDGSVVRRETACGAAWFVEGTHTVATAREEIELLGRIDPKETAVASTEMKASGRSNDLPVKAYDASGTIELVEYSPNSLKYEYTSEEPAFAVFSEIFYDKGWSVRIDGSDEESPYYRVDYILRGMELPAGTHTVEWMFRAPKWGMASAVTFVFSAAILAAVAAAIAVWIIRKYRKRDE